MKKSSKIEVKDEIEEFFKDILNKTAKEIEKMKKLAMSYKIPLKEHRKKYCKHCYYPYLKPSIRIKNNKIAILCENCKKKSRWKIK